MLLSLLLPVLVPDPSPTASLSPGVRPLSVQIGQVHCPDRALDVTIHNPDSNRAQSYTLLADQEFLRLEEVPPSTTFLSKVILDADGTMVITVVEGGRTIASSTVTAACASPTNSAGPTRPTPPKPTASPAPPQPSSTPSSKPSGSPSSKPSGSPTPTPTPSVTRRAFVTPPSHRPSPPVGRRLWTAHTLPFTGSGAETTARLITGLAVVVFGGLLVFYGLLWPRDGCGDWPCPLRRTR